MGQQPDQPQLLQVCSAEQLRSRACINALSLGNTELGMGNLTTVYCNVAAILRDSEGVNTAASPS